MSFYEAFKDAIKVAQKTDNLDLYKQLLDLSAQALDLQEENARLRTENEQLIQQKDIEAEIIRYEEPFITLRDDEKETKYCSRCWDAERKLVQIRCMENGYFSCPNCRNEGIYDKQLVGYHRHINDGNTFPIL